MEEKIKDIIAVFIKTPATDIHSGTIIDRSVMGSSIMLHRMYARLAEQGVMVDDYPDIRNYGNLLQKIKGWPTNGQTVGESDPGPVVTLVSQPQNNGNAAAIGIDIQEISALPVTNDFREDFFYTSNFSASEIAYCILQPDSYASFAGLFAAKEAMVKADNSLAKKSFSSIVVEHQPSGKPSHPDFYLSVSHSAGLAVAVAVQLPAPNPVYPTLYSPAPASKSAFFGILVVIAFVIAVIAMIIALKR